MRWRYGLLFVALLCWEPGGKAQSANTASPVLAAAKEELTRSFSELQKQEVPAYYLSYQIQDIRKISIESSFGTLMQSSEGHSRIGAIDLRVGDYSLDNTHPLRGNMAGAGLNQFSRIAMPVEDDALSIRNVLWLNTDHAYRQAAEQLTRVKTNEQVKIAEEDKSSDFSKEEPSQAIEPLKKLEFDQKLWEEKLRRYTAPFRRYGDIYSARAVLSAEQNIRWFVASDGSMVQTSQVRYRLLLSAISKADDGMELPRYETFFAFTPEGLPDDAVVQKTVDKMIADLKSLRTAPVVDPYTGPAMLSGRATAVFFHEVLGHRLEGHRQKNEADAQTYKKMLGQAILPNFLSVTFDPTQQHLGSTDLMGYYAFDDQGVKARPVSIVDKGVLKSFLLSRMPIAGFPQSNGHGRAEAGFPPVARQSNLLITNSMPISHEELKHRLIAEIKKQNKPFGLLFDDIEGGFTLTGRTIPNAFNVLPVMVYRVYPNGKEELVRGVDLIGTPLTVFSKIIAADNETAVFNGVCGAESGGVPVSASGPAILVSQIEVQKKAKSEERAPILPAPLDTK